MFTPRPRFKDFAELNRWLADQCIAISKKRNHPEDNGQTIWEMFEKEQPSLIPTNAPFAGYVEKEYRVSRTSLISYDRNSYSADTKVAGKTATIRATAGLIQVVKDGEIVGEHVRQFGR